MGFGETITVFKDNVAAAAQSKWRKLAKRLTKKKFTAAAPVLAVCVLIVIIVSIITAALIRTKPKTAPPAVFTQEKISGEDIFLPNEPDFLPDIIFEQPQKPVWNESDAAPFWTDPRELGEAMWRDKITGTIDTLLERVP